MVKLIANARLTYGTRRLRADDLFDARFSSDARALVAVGKARYAPAEEAAPKTEAKPTAKKPARPRKAKAAK